MKKYFAKYLPVEGEIKPDNRIFYNNRSAMQGAVDYVIYYEDLKNIVLDTQEQIDSRKKVKLFLCSRDIQLGDEITWIGTEGPPSTPFGGKMKHDTPLTRGKMHENWIKVIGEISPDATWVKEGDEFDENEVRIEERCKECLGNQGAQAWCGCTNENIQFAYVKGPCGHFH